MSKALNDHKVLGSPHPLVVYHHGQNYLLNGCMAYLTECLRESPEYDYWFFSGVTGDSFTQVHYADGDRAASSLTEDVFGPEILDRAFGAIGYGYSLVTQREVAEDQEACLRRVIASIDRGVPVIALGFEVTDTFCVLCGYEESGAKLQCLRNDEELRSVAAESLSRTKALVLAGEKRQAPPLADVYRRTVASIPSFIKRAPQEDLVFGKAAFEAWAAALESAESLLAGQSDERMEELRWRLQCGPLCIAGTNGCSRGFLEKALRFCPDLEVIPRLQPIYEEMQQLFEEISALQGGFWIPFPRLRDAETRCAIAAKVRRFIPCCDGILEAFGNEGRAR
ncbi:MAG TPA: hypothetical protein VGN26_20260 [Armatimonadota bacterium]|jgi:hypothetical protein